MRGWAALVAGTLFAAAPARAQELRHLTDGLSLSVQYAGSIGTFSVGAMRHSTNGKLAGGLFYGRTPAAQGGPLDAYTAKFMYTPWRLSPRPKWVVEPLQTGVFVTYWRGLALSSHWPGYLEKGYYWWTANFRQHLFLRAQVSYRLPSRTWDRVGLWFEANTNDLYLYSWWPNRRSISLYDITFFGTGVQLYFRAPPHMPPPANEPPR